MKNIKKLSALLLALCLVLGMAACLSISIDTLCCITCDKLFVCKFLLFIFLSNLKIGI